MSDCETYRDFVISYQAPPIPVRDCDYIYHHKDYDGPEDNRIGTAASVEACKEAIDEWHADQEEEALLKRMAQNLN
jgi:hypothetical protein